MSNRGPQLTWERGWEGTRASNFGGSRCYRSPTSSSGRKTRSKSDPEERLSGIRVVLFHHRQRDVERELSFELHERIAQTTLNNIASSQHPLQLDPWR